MWWLLLLALLNNRGVVVFVPLCFQLGLQIGTRSHLLVWGWCCLLLDPGRGICHKLVEWISCLWHRGGVTLLVLLRIVSSLHIKLVCGGKVDFVCFWVCGRIVLMLFWRIQACRDGLVVYCSPIW
jgi:hypothetical protein